ncbi:MAG: hypothetical protein EXX96DRAFT_346898 [Benjaminiella poitrasii]|nr:MAG: hypothetical protein EXX96DRAFT_346898 [Benjaminiella poitrasii]
MLQSQIINVLPHRIIASLWAKQETRISLSHLSKLNTLNEQQPAATTPAFICNELPTRYTHMLRLLSTLSPEALQSPIIRHVAHSYLRDICTLLHPSLKETSPKAFTNVLSDLRQRQTTNLIRLKYALLSSSSTNTTTLLDNINTIGTGIYLLLDQYVSFDSNQNDHAQPIRPEQIAHEAVSDARHTLSTAFNTKIPTIEIIEKDMPREPITYIPSVLHRILYETSLLALKPHVLGPKASGWLDWLRRDFRRQRPTLSMRLFGGPTSIGFRLESTEQLITTDLVHDIPRDLLGIPSCPSVLSTILDDRSPMLHTTLLTGWRAAKQLASHWGGHLDHVSADGLGSTLYLALDRDPSLVERYPTSFVKASEQLLRQQGRLSAIGVTSVQAAAVQLDAFLYAISDQPQTWYERQSHHHSVSLMAAVGNT